MKSIQLFLTCALLVAAIPSATAGRVKGIKGSVAPPAAAATTTTTTTRVLKEGKDKKTKEAKGPSVRSCISTASAKEVTFECKSGTGDLKATSGTAAATSSTPAIGKDDKTKESSTAATATSTTSDKGGQKEAGTTAAATEPAAGANKESQTTQASSSASEAKDEEPSTRGIYLTPDEAIRDKIKYKVSTRKEGIRVKIQYEQDVETEDGHTDTDTEFELVFDRVIEYAKNASASEGQESEAYDWESDEVVQTIDLARWEDITRISTDENQTVSFFTAMTTLMPETGTAAAGTILFNYTISQADVNERITANSMKIDVHILNFPWVRENSYVALLSTVESKKRVHLHYTPNATLASGHAHVAQDLDVSFSEEMSDLGISAFGRYSWASEAEVNSNGFSGLVNNNVFTSRQGNANANASKVPLVEAEESEGAAYFDGETDVEPTVESSSVNGSSTSVQPTEEPIDMGTNGNTIKVIATSPETNSTDNFQSIAYSFVGRGAHSASEIYWDPQAGVGYEEPLEASAASRALRCSMSLMTSSLIGATFFWSW